MLQIYIYVYNSILLRNIALGVRVPFLLIRLRVIKFHSNIIFTLSLPCYGLDDQQ